MADSLAPNPQFLERDNTHYEEKFADNVRRRGPLRFEEGVATDTDVPNDFVVGVQQGYTTAPGRPNHNQNVYQKWPEETLKQRAHVGSSAWAESPTYLGEFAGGSGEQEQKYVKAVRSGTRYERQNAAEVWD